MSLPGFEHPGHGLASSPKLEFRRNRCGFSYSASVKGKAMNIFYIIGVIVVVVIVARFFGIG
jgi:hypothetical protein